MPEDFLNLFLIRELFSKFLHKIFVIYFRDTIDFENF